MAEELSAEVKKELLDEMGKSISWLATHRNKSLKLLLEIRESGFEGMVTNATRVARQSVKNASRYREEASHAGICEHILNVTKSKNYLSLLEFVQKN